MTTQPPYPGDELFFDLLDPSGTRVRVFDRADHGDRIVSFRYNGVEIGAIVSGFNEADARALALLICPDLLPLDPAGQPEHPSREILSRAYQTTRIVNRPPILRFFEYAHLPENLQAVSRPFCELAEAVAVAEHREEVSEETLVALRKLLEAKDAAVRAALR